MNLVYMKTKIYLGILSLVLGLSLASCSEDDDYISIHHPDSERIVGGDGVVRCDRHYCYTPCHALRVGWHGCRKL